MYGIPYLDSLLEVEVAGGAQSLRLMHRLCVQPFG